MSQYESTGGGFRAERGDLLAERFEAHRTHLRAVAHRMLGSLAEADDAVQEAWFRLSRSDIREVGNLGGWLTTVVGRVCLDMLRSRKSRAEEPLDGTAPVPAATADPEQDALLADSVGVALLVVLDTLTPAERLAFVLHDLFAVPYEEIAAILDRTPTAARQLASRARRRVRGVPEPDTGPGGRGEAQARPLSAGHALSPHRPTVSGTPGADTERRGRSRQRQIVDAFLAAAREGDFDGLLEVLDPDVVARSEAGVTTGAAAVARGAASFAHLARVARPALVDGVTGLVVLVDGRVERALVFAFENDRIAVIDIVADPGRLSRLDVEPSPSL